MLYILYELIECHETLADHFSIRYTIFYITEKKSSSSHRKNMNFCVTLD